jgi:integrase
VSWIRAKAGSPETALVYRREADRLQLWCAVERRKPLSSMDMDDCLAYMAFLQHIPPEWISRRHTPRLAEGWAPFSTQLAIGSQRQAIVIVSGMFTWLVKAHYLRANPWVLVNRKTGDDPDKSLLDTRAFTKEAWGAIRSSVVSEKDSKARARALFIMDFTEATGLRSAELLSTTLGRFRRVGRRWALEVVGKGNKKRVVAVPHQAVEALEVYLASRGLPTLAKAPVEAPLVASNLDPMVGVGYQALYESTKAWFRRAIRSSDLTGVERDDALRASLHWLRHTCGTRALERGTPVQTVQKQFGHKDPRTTMRYAKSQLEEMLDGMEVAFGG